MTYALSRQGIIAFIVQLFFIRRIWIRAFSQKVFLLSWYLGDDFSPRQAIHSSFSHGTSYACTYSTTVANTGSQIPIALWQLSQSQLHINPRRPERWFLLCDLVGSSSTYIYVSQGLATGWLVMQSSHSLCTSISQNELSAVSWKFLRCRARFADAFFDAQNLVRQPFSSVECCGFIRMRQPYIYSLRISSAFLDVIIATYMCKIIRVSGPSLRRY